MDIYAYIYILAVYIYVYIYIYICVCVCVCVCVCDMWTSDSKNHLTVSVLFWETLSVRYLLARDVKDRFNAT